MNFIPGKERAAIIRSELKANFPKVKFSVRSSSFRMRDTVTISWILGPTKQMVMNVIFCLVEDTKNIYNICMEDEKQIFINYSREIPQEVFDKVRAEVKETATEEMLQYSFLIDEEAEKKIRNMSF
jgi:Large polyvalent protein associated domain 29